MKVQRQIDPKSYQSANGFIYHYQQLVKDVVIPYQYQVLNDQVEGVEKSHVVANFRNAGRMLRGEDPGDGFYGMIFQDSDAAKWLEAVASALTRFPDAQLEKEADELIELIAQAQDKDGYLDTRFTLKERDKRWTNLCEGHELYCMGHMMEAAAAYFEATGKRTLLDVMIRNAEYLYQRFVVEGQPGYPGHPEVELALLKLYRVTGNEHCLKLAEHFIDVRGVNPHFYQEEAKKRDWTEWHMNVEDTQYMQCDKPVRELSDATGHSVRAMYLYTAMADLASQTEDPALKAACRRLWESTTHRRMYVTGGIGSTCQGEAFTVDYDLPNDTAYTETCAGIGLMFFASRMLEMDADAEYADVMERAFYNAVLAGMQLDGKRFFYVNPLEVIPGVSGKAITHLHDLPVRPGWYSCACCPPNVARLLSSFGQYAYGQNETTAFCHLYAEGEVRFDNGLRLQCETGYPYEMEVRFRALEGKGQLAVRLPGWSRHTTLVWNGAPAEYETRKGYAYVELQPGDELVLRLDGSVHQVYANPKVFEDTGCTALQRGPLVYCFEEVDNGDVRRLSLRPESQWKALPLAPGLLGGIVPLQGEGLRTAAMEGLYAYERPARTPATLTAVPYYTWGNRGEGSMRVWLPEA